MTNEERDLIARFVARVAGAGQSSGFGGSVPATTPQLPPIDPEADQFIAEQFSRYPEARYRITQMAFVQEAALAEAQNRIRRLEWELNQARQAQAQGGQAQGGQPQVQGPGQPARGGFFSNLFGGHSQSAPPQPQQPAPGAATQQQYQQPQPQYQPPPPQYPPNYQPGMFQRAGGSGFLGSALTTAAGVAGGVLAADALTSMFSHHGGGFAGGGYVPTETVNETVVNNYGPQDGVGQPDPWAGAGAPDPNAGGNPWAGAGTDQGSFDQGVDPSSFDQGSFDQGSFDQGDPGGFDNGGGWDDGGLTDV